MEDQKSRKASFSREDMLERLKNYVRDDSDDRADSSLEDSEDVVRFRACVARESAAK